MDKVELKSMKDFCRILPRWGRSSKWPETVDLKLSVQKMTVS